MCALVGLLTIAGTGFGLRLGAQTAWEWEVQGFRAAGQSVQPVFEGWYPNGDGTFSLSFGYYNRNYEEAVDVPLGPDNFIEPAMYDGNQPTHFRPQPRDQGPGRGIRYWSVFTVVVPADFGDQRVVWTLRSAGETLAVPGHLGNSNYEMDALRVDARGYTPPVLRLSQEGPTGIGPGGIRSGPLQARVGQPLALTTWASDENPPITVVWFKHQGPGAVAFADGQLRIAEGSGQVATSATFDQPGRYVLRVRVTNDVTEFDRFCCWTNGYVEVLVSE